MLFNYYLSLKRLRFLYYVVVFEYFMFVYLISLLTIQTFFDNIVNITTTYYNTLTVTDTKRLLELALHRFFTSISTF